MCWREPNKGNESFATGTDNRSETTILQVVLLSCRRDSPQLWYFANSANWN